MWRFILISFVVLGWGFYELSGGADYEPAPNSLQARGAPARPAPEPKPRVSDRPSPTLAEVAATMDGLRHAETEARELSVTLAATRLDGAGIIAAEASRPKAELLTLALPEPARPGDAAIATALAAALGRPATDPAQLRWVRDGLADLRDGPGPRFDTIAQIAKGTEVAVLEAAGNGWVKVRVSDDNQTGWVAEWLLVKPR